MKLEGNMIVTVGGIFYKVLTINTVTGWCFLRGIKSGVKHRIHCTDITPYFLQSGDKIGLHFQIDDQDRWTTITVMDIDMFEGKLQLLYKDYDGSETLTEPYILEEIFESYRHDEI